jgi:hypothetical protein
VSKLFTMNIKELIDPKNAGHELQAAALGLYDYRRREHTRFGLELIRVMKVATSDVSTKNRDAIRALMELKPIGMPGNGLAYYEYSFQDLCRFIGFVDAVKKAYDYAIMALPKFNDNKLTNSYHQFFGQHCEINCTGTHPDNINYVKNYVVVTDLVGNIVLINGKPSVGTWAEFEVEKHITKKEWKRVK